MNFIKTADHNSLVGFYRQNGLEVSDDIAGDDGAVFSVKCVEDGAFLSAATLSLRFGVYILDYIAVDPEFRRQGIGEKTVAEIIKKAEGLGADKVYLTARNPMFFEKIGFKEGSPNGVDMNADCVGCPQFGNGCRKLPMYIDVY